MIPKKISGKYSVRELQFYNGEINYMELLDYLSSRKDFAPCFKDEAPNGHDLRQFTFDDLYGLIIGLSGGVTTCLRNTTEGSYLYGVLSKDGVLTTYAVTIMGKPIGIPASELSPVPVMTVLFSDINKGLRTENCWSTFYECRYLVHTGSGGWTWKCIETDRTDILGMQEKLKEILL